MPPEKWFGIKSVLDPDETIITDYGFYHLTNKRLIRSRLFRSKFEKMGLDGLQVLEDKGLVNMFFYPMIVGLVFLMLAPIFYLFAGMPLFVFVLNLVVAAGFSASQFGIWSISRKGAFLFRSNGKSWRLMTNNGPLGSAFVNKVRETLSQYNLNNDY